jgi:hypothetical protein
MINHHQHQFVLKGFMKLNLELEREENDCSFAIMTGLPSVTTYGPARQEAISRVKVLTLNVICDRFEHGKPVPEISDLLP